MSILPISAIYIVATAYNMWSLREWASAETDEHLTQLATQHAHRINAHLREMAQIARSTASALEAGTPTEAEVYTQLEANLRHSQLVYGSATAFEPYAFDPKRRLVSPYVYRSDGRAARMDIGAEAYDYQDGTWDWYSLPSQQGRPVWTPPYFDEGAGNILMCTYSVPFYNKGKLWGVTTVDIALEPLRSLVDREIAEDLDFAVLTDTGRYVYAQNPELIVSKTWFEIAREIGRDDLYTLGGELLSGRPGVSKVPGWHDDQAMRLVFYAPIASTRWTFVASVPEAQAMAFVEQQWNRRIGVFLVTLATVITLLWILARRITEPILELTRTASQIAAGDLAAEIPIRSNDEIGALARSFSEMEINLRERERDLHLRRQQQFGELVEGLAGKYFYYIQDSHGKFTFVSESITEVLGYTTDEFMADYTSFLVVESELNDQAIARSDASIRGEQQPPFQLDVYDKEGRIRRLEVFERPIFDDAGNVTQVEGMAGDITDRIEEMERFRRLLDSAPDGMIVVDATGEIVMVNIQAERLFGYTRDEMIGQKVELLVPDGALAGHEAMRNAFADNPEVRQMGAGRELKAKQKNGSEFSVEISLSPVETDSGLLISAAVRDITERKIAEDALRKNQEQLRALVDNVNAVVFLKDLEGRHLLVNRYYEEATGIASADVIGKTDHEVYPREVADHITEIDRKVMETGEILSFEEQVPHTDGSVHDYLTVKIPLKNESGEIYGMCGLATDVTEIKVAQGEAEEARLQAEEALKRAEEANRTKSAFLANISHEIRTPLNAILGFTDILSATAPDHQKGYLEAIKTAGESLLAMINDVLDLARMDAGDISLRSEPMVLHRTIRECTELVQDSAKAKGLDLRVDLQPQVPAAIVLDESRLRQVLLNLLGNAIKFTETGSVAVTVDTLSQQNDRVDLNISIIDSGVGIPADQMDRIFASFTQKEGQSINDFGGTGMGLAISQRLTRLMGGTLEVQSEVGQGSTFTVNLRDVQVASADQFEHIREGDLDPNAVRFENATVLVADDILLERQVITGYLGTLGLTVVEAENGEEALEQMRRHQPDIVLMDIKMPILDGFSAAKRARGNDALKRISVVAVTGADIRESVEELSAVFDGILSKPLTRERLIHELTRFLNFELQDHLSEPTVSGPEWTPERMSDQERATLPALIGRLEEQIPQYRELASTLTVNEIEAFAAEIGSVPEASSYPPLSTWAERLESQARSFDVDGMTRTLNAFPDLIDSITEIANG